MRIRRGGAAGADAGPPYGAGCSAEAAPAVALPPAGVLPAAVTLPFVSVLEVVVNWFGCAASGLRILQICDVVGAGAGGARPMLRSEASVSLTGAPTAMRIDSDCEPDHSLLHLVGAEPSTDSRSRPRHRPPAAHWNIRSLPASHPRVASCTLPTLGIKLKSAQRNKRTTA